MKRSFIEAGEIVTSHGLKGEMKVLPWLDSPEDLCAFARCRIDGRDYEMTRCRVQKTCCLVTLAGVTTVEQAQSLRGKTLEIFREDVSGAVIFAAELMGMAVYDGGEHIGEIADVLSYPGNSVYVVRGKHEYMIPAVGQFIKSTDLEKNEMHVHLIEGMRTDEN